jgi:hypothetical protein
VWDLNNPWNMSVNFFLKGGARCEIEVVCGEEAE